METYYISNETIIIFDPQYNEPLDPELLSHYKKIIFIDYELQDGLFANYELDDELFETYSNDDSHNFKYIRSKFNQPLCNALVVCTELTTLVFGHEFNQPQM